MFESMTRLLFPPVILVLALGAYRVGYRSFELPPMQFTRSQPQRIEPRYDWPQAVSDEQLHQVLDRVKPPVTMPLTNNLVHALRLWGPTANFGSDQIPSGQEMLRYLLDDREFQRWAGAEQPPLFTRDEHGVRPRNFEDDATHSKTASYHIDDLLATLAESEVSLDEKMHLRDGSAAPVRELLSQSLHSFYLKRFEYEWTMIAYARYAHPLTGWQNHFGDKLTAESLVEEMLAHRPDVGPCNGLHRLEALVLLYRADEQANTLSPRVKQRMLAYMSEMSRLLQASQTVHGYWSRQWVKGPQGSKDLQAPLSDRVLVTGHHLEWLALAPEEVLPPRETIVRACQWVARTMPELEERELIEHYGPFSHAARALCLWRSREPFEAWNQRTSSAE
jgi:hypothetical protein